MMSRTKTKTNRNTEMELRKEWASALRSGKYKQGSCCLRKDDLYCPLGVLAELVAKKYPKAVTISKDAQGRTTYNGDALLLTEEITSKIGLVGPDGAFRDTTGKYMAGLEENVECSLATIADRGATFSQVADLIDNPKSRLFWE